MIVLLKIKSAYYHNNQVLVKNLLGQKYQNSQKMTRPIQFLRARASQLAIARISYGNSVCPSVTTRVSKSLEKVVLKIDITSLGHRAKIGITRLRAPTDFRMTSYHAPRRLTRLPGPLQIADARAEELPVRADDLAQEHYFQKMRVKTRLERRQVAFTCHGLKRKARVMLE